MKLIRQYFRVAIALIVLTLISSAICYSSSEVKDARGKKFVLSHPPQKIISLSPAITEILFALGLDKEIAGVTTLCDYPTRAKKKTKIGSYIHPNLERIIDLQPDLVFATTHTFPTIQKLEKLGVLVFVIEPKTLQASLDSIFSVGKITGKTEEATKIVASLNQRIRAITDRMKSLGEEDKPFVFWQIGSNPLVTVGPETLGHDLITQAGGRNIAADTLIDYPRYSLEAILYKNPQVIIVVGMIEDDYSRDEIQKWNKWKNLLAVKNRRIYRVDSDLVTRRGSPRVVDGLEALACILHPELFDQKNNGENNAQK